MFFGLFSTFSCYLLPSFSYHSSCLIENFKNSVLWTCFHDKNCYFEWFGNKIFYDSFTSVFFRQIVTDLDRWHKQQPRFYDVENLWNFLRFFSSCKNKCQPKWGSAERQWPYRQRLVKIGAEVFELWRCADYARPYFWLFYLPP